MKELRDTIRHALYELPPNGRVNHPLRDPALDALDGLIEQYEALRGAVDAFFAEPLDYQRPCWDSFCGGGSHTTLCHRVYALAASSFPATSSEGSEALAVRGGQADLGNDPSDSSPALRVDA